MIITNLNKLRVPVPATDFVGNEAEIISTILFDELSKAGGLGLSANQVGVNRRVCVVNVTEPIYLVNPKIVDTSPQKVTYVESCLSIPRTLKKLTKTERHQWVTVQADNLPSDITFGPDDLSSWEKDPTNFWNDVGFLQAVVVQHEIDHLDGITIRDRQYQPDDLIGKKTYGRNELVMFINPTTGDAEFNKFKHGRHLLDEGWTVQ
jgi:peptide deformylase